MKTIQEEQRNLVERIVRDSIRVKEKLLKTSVDVIVEMSSIICSAFRGGRPLFLFGNGGSAADAQHLAAEFVNRFQMERRPLPAVALTVDSSIITSISNDYRFDDIFLKQLQALGRPGDVALGISTSGRSINVVKALRWAREHGIQTLGFSGGRKAEMDVYCDLILHVNSDITARIQESHIMAGHALCDLVERALFDVAREEERIE